MFNMNRVVGGMKLSAAVLVVGLVGCGADATGTPAGGQTPILAAGAGSSLPGPSLGAAGVGSSVVPKAGTGSSPIVVPPTGAAGISAAAGTTALPANGGLAGTTAALPVAGGAPGAAGSGGVVPPVNGSTWTDKSNLDATGVLMPPASGQGFQIATPVFDLQPGQELFKCFHVAVPTNAEFPVGEWDGQMTAGSHHFILYRSDADTSATQAGVLTNSGCTQGFGGTTWLYTQGTPRSHLAFPDGVAMALASQEKLNFDMHYINTGTEVIHARVILNANKVKTETYMKADAQISYNVGINVPAHGTQTVGGDCTPAAGANYFVMQTHTHKHATLAVVNRKLANGMMGEELVKTTNWDNPQAHIWQSAPFLTFQPGETFHYSCSYQNDSSTAVRVGTSADVNEMCMAEAYFFPATATTPACN
jgi:hypothetical protein